MAHKSASNRVIIIIMIILIIMIIITIIIIIIITIINVEYLNRINLSVQIVLLAKGSCKTQSKSEEG